MKSINCVKFSVKYSDSVYSVLSILLFSKHCVLLVILIIFSELIHVRSGAPKVHIWLLLEQVS